MRQTAPIRADTVVQIGVDCHLAAEYRTVRHGSRLFAVLPYGGTADGQKPAAQIGAVRLPAACFVSPDNGVLSRFTVITDPHAINLSGVTKRKQAKMCIRDRLYGDPRL